MRLIAASDGAMIAMLEIQFDSLHVLGLHNGVQD